MREIKFRACDSWISGGQFRYIKSNYDLEYWISDGSKGEENMLGELEWQQFTGLKDKKGVDIYEGDVVEFNDWADDENVWVKEVVVFEGGAFYPVSNRTSTEFIVIGNIFQNPELIKN